MPCQFGTAPGGQGYKQAILASGPAQVGQGSGLPKARPLVHKQVADKMQRTGPREAMDLSAKYKRTRPVSRSFEHLSANIETGRQALMPQPMFRPAGAVWRCAVAAFSVWISLLLAPKAAAQDGFLSYSTYLGGNAADKIHGIATDPDGNVYVTGETYSSDLPVTPGALQSEHAGRPGTVTSVFEISALADAFVMKFGPAGELLYGTYLGGSQSDVGRSIAVDAAGNAYVLGSTSSSDFPTTAGARQVSFGSGGPHLFVAKLNSSGSALAYSTFLGGSEDEAAGSLAIDSAGGVYVTGATSSPDFPVTPSAVNGVFAPGALRMPFAARLDAAGASLAYSTFLGGSQNGMGRGIAVDAAANAYISGETSSADFPVTPGAIGSAGSGAFAVKLNASGSALVYAARFGGENEIVSGIAMDGEGNAWIAGGTDSASFPVTAGAVDQPGGEFDVWVVKLNPAASEFVYAVRFGGEKTDLAAGIAVDALGNALVTGSTSSQDFPAAAGARPFPPSQCFYEVHSPFPPPPLEGSCGEAFVAKLDAAGSTLTYATTLGGADGDSAEGLSLDSGGNVYVAGLTRSNNFPTTQGALSNRRFPSSCRLTGSPSFSVNTFCEDAFVSNVSFGKPPDSPPVEVLNLGSMTFSPPAPEAVVKLAGARIGPLDAAGLTLGDDGRVTTGLSNTRVLFDGVPAPLLLVSADEINVIAPAALGQKATTRIDIERNGSIASTLTVGVAAAAPALLTLDGTGAGQAAAINEDGAVNTAETPAPAGSVLALYVVGMGSTGEPDGAVAAAARDLSETWAPLVRIGGEPAEVVYAGLAPGLITAATQINVRVPDLPPGAAAVVVITNGYASQAGATVAVQ